MMAQRWSAIVSVKLIVLVLHSGAVTRTSDVAMEWPERAT